MRIQRILICPIALASLALLLGPLGGSRFFCPAAFAQSISAADALSFSTSGQSLWGPGAGEKTKEFHSTLIDLAEQGSRGSIVRVDREISAQAACDAWERAVTDCDAEVYRWGLLSFSPTRQQCIAGVRYCFPNPFGEDPCIVVPAIGPKPPCTTTKPFDAGAVVTWDALFQWGIQGGITLDPGSVDVEVATTATIEVSEADFDAGDVITIRTTEIAPDVKLRSRWPSVSGHIDTFLNARAVLQARAAAPNTQTGQQMDRTATLFEQDTRGTKVQTLAGFKAGTGGLELRILDETFEVVPEGVEHTAVVGLTLPGAVEIGIAICDLGLYFPQMDTPAAPGFAGKSLNGIFDGTRIVNSLQPGTRTAFQIGVINSEGTMDTDVGRFDLDLDALATLAWLMPPGGLNASIDAGPVTLLEVEGNVFDLDAVLFLGFKESLAFEPRLMVNLVFGQPIMAETSPGSNRFEMVGSKRVRIGESLRIVYPGGDLAVDPVYTIEENLFINDTDLVVSPMLQGAVFELKLGGLVHEMVGEQIGLPDHMAAAQVSVDLKEEPWKLADLNFLDQSSQAEFALGGFRDVPGSRLVIRPGGRALLLRGDSNGDATVDISDPIHVLSYLFNGGSEPRCMDAADADDNGDLDITDAIVMLGELFTDSAAIAPPYPTPGEDPTPDGLAACGGAAP